MTKYKLVDGTTVQDTETTAFRSVESPEYVEWLAEGNTPDPADLMPWEVPPSKEDLLSDTDKKMARVAEDVIDVLIGKGVISLEDLPSTVTDVIIERKQLRESQQTKTNKNKRSNK